MQKTETQPQKHKIPILGMLSLLAPCIGGGIFYWIDRSTSGSEESLGSFFIGFMIFICSIGCGGILGLIGLICRERHWWVAGLGILLNAAPVIYALVVHFFLDQGG